MAPLSVPSQGTWSACRACSSSPVHLLHDSDSPHSLINSNPQCSPGISIEVAYLLHSRGKCSAIDAFAFDHERPAKRSLAVATTQHFRLFFLVGFPVADDSQSWKGLLRHHKPPESSVRSITHTLVHLCCLLSNRLRQALTVPVSHPPRFPQTQRFLGRSATPQACIRPRCWELHRRKTTDRSSHPGASLLARIFVLIYMLHVTNADF